MPIYAYKCDKCGHEFEKIEKLDAPHKQRCPRCKGRAHRQLTAPAIQFKGSGWYVTDYSRKSAPPPDTGGKKEEAGATATGEAKEAKESKEVKEKPKKEKKTK